MLEFLFSDAAVPFTSALVLMVLIGLVEAVGLGFPGQPDIDHDGALSWLGFGRVPVLASIATLLACFGFTGLVGQQTALALTEGTLSLPLAIAASAVVALPLTALLSRGLARIMPRDETTAVDPSVLVGQIASITIGCATSGSPARAQVRDYLGQLHNIMVEPELSDQSLNANDRVLLVRREGHVFRAILHEEPRYTEWTAT